MRSAITREVALPRAEHLRDGLQPAGHLGLDAGDLGDLVVHLARPLGGGGRIEGALAAGLHEESTVTTRSRTTSAAKAERRLAPGDRPRAEDERESSCRISSRESYPQTNKDRTNDERLTTRRRVLIHRAS